MTISTRPATVCYAAAMGKAHVLSWQYAYKGMINQTTLDDLKITDRVSMWDKVLTNKKANNLQIVLLNNDEVIGFAVGTPTHADMFFLHAMYIHPDHTGNGYGDKLLNAFKQECLNRSFKKMECGVLTANKNARKFYEKNGGVWQPSLAEDWKCFDGNEYPEGTYHFDLTKD
ncbi:MAG: GNAT superfamily N-acetyltransferase [Alphaproteobacteria bacterium]|jgi:GNAT superfamily N-acetyltransferase